VIGSLVDWISIFQKKLIRNMAFKPFKDLEVYKECRLLRKSISETVKTHFPESEKYKLTDQIIRSSRRVTACIAEGHGAIILKRTSSTVEWQGVHFQKRLNI